MLKESEWYNYTLNYRFLLFCVHLLDYSSAKALQETSPFCSINSTTSNFLMLSLLIGARNLLLSLTAFP